MVSLDEWVLLLVYGFKVLDYMVGSIGFETWDDYLALNLKWHRQNKKTKSRKALMQAQESCKRVQVLSELYKGQRLLIINSHWAEAKLTGDSKAE